MVGVTEDLLPTVRLISPGPKEMIKFIYSDQMTEENVAKYLNKFKEGKLKPYLKSEQIPKNQTGPVVKIVARNFIDTIE